LFPLALTDPIPLSIDADVAFWLDQRNVADCPRSMAEGSTVKLAITGLAGGGGGGAFSTTFGAGGGGAGPFFLHPAAKNAKDMAINNAPNLRLLILNLPPCPPNLRGPNVVY
jgi:hypothetical protein